jgi:cobalamin biosynthesis protein CobT
LSSFLGDSGVQRLEALLATKLYSAASTAETYNIAGQVLQLIKDIDQEQQEPPENSPDDENQDGDHEGEERGGSSVPDDAGDGADAGGQDDQQDGQQGNDHGDDQSGQPEDGDDGSQADTNPKGQGDQKSDDGDSQDAQSGGEVEDVSGGNAAGGTPPGASAILQDDDVDTGPVVDLKATVEEAVEALEKTGAFVPGVSGYSPPSREANSDRYATLKAHIGGEIAQLQRRLAAMFETRRRCRSIISDEGRLDSRRLHLALAGSRAVYRRKEVKVVPKPAVSFALDCSGSMNGMAMDLALQAVIAVVEVCDRMAVPTEIVVFGWMVGVVKGFENPLPRNRAVLGGIEAGGGTPAAEGLWEAASHLVQRQEDRKILFVVTDGSPNRPQATKEVGEMIEASGIELYGIGVGSDAIRNYCSKAEVLTNANGIAAAVLTALEARMLKREGEGQGCLSP